MRKNKRHIQDMNLNRNTKKLATKEKDKKRRNVNEDGKRENENQYEIFLQRLKKKHVIEKKNSNEKNVESLKDEEVKQKDNDEFQITDNEEKEEKSSEEEFTEELEDEKEKEKDIFERRFNHIKEEDIETNGSFNDDNENEIIFKTEGYLVKGKFMEPVENYDTKPIKLAKYFIRDKLRKQTENEILNYKDRIQKLIFDRIFKYQDVHFVYKTHDNFFYKSIYLLHSINHVYKTRYRILKNNFRLSSSQNEELECKDQGFTRPKVLILLPKRYECYKLVNLLIQLSGIEQQENKKRFNDEFSTEKKTFKNKPIDFETIFKGNNNDFFCLGLKFTRKCLKLYSSFYSSDIIIASPLGLFMILKNPTKKKRQSDFLSSIEILIVDHANQIEMQNWSHMSVIFSFVNKIPKEFHDSDFSRIRMWYINDKSKFLRQTLIFSEFSTPNVNSLILSKLFNISGNVILKSLYDSENCFLRKLGCNLRFLFHRIESASLLDDHEKRFDFFKNTMFSEFNKYPYENGILLYIPQYFDFVRINLYLKNHSKIVFGSINEYSSNSEIARARHQFLTGKLNILLYTERLHHFRRFDLSGVKLIFLYQIPLNPLFLNELVSFVKKSSKSNIVDLNLSFVKGIFSKWDFLSLESFFGREKAIQMCSYQNDVFEFK